MAFIATQHAAMARIEFGLGTQFFSVNPWFTKDTFSTTDQEALADLVDAATTSVLKPRMSSEISYYRVTVYDMRTETGAIVVNNDGNGACAISNPPAYINSACVLTLYTANRGRSGRGRLYFGGFSVGDTENGHWKAQIRTDCEGFYDTLNTAALAAGWTPVVVSRYTAGGPRPSGLAQPVTEWSVRSLLMGTQRRRIDRT
jgi:hypothetical protein